MDRIAQDAAPLSTDHPPAAHRSNGEQQWLVSLVLGLLACQLAGLVIASLVGACWLLAKTDYLRPTYRLTVHVPDALGLKPEAPVMMRGIRIGSVEETRLDSTGETPSEARLLLKIRSEYAIPSGARFVLTPSMMGIDGQVTVVPPQSSEQASTIPPDTEGLRGETPFNPSVAMMRTDQLLQQMDSTLAKVETLLAESAPVARQAGRVLSTFTTPQVQGNLREATAQVRGLTTNANRITGQVSTLLARAGTVPADNLNRITGNLATVTGDMTALTRTVRQETPTLLSETRDTVRSAAQLARESSSLLTSEIRPQMSRLTGLIDSLTASSKSLETVAASAKSFSEDTALHTDLRETAQNMAQITERLPALLDSMQTISRLSTSLLEKALATADKAAVGGSDKKEGEQAEGDQKKEGTSQGSKP